MLKRLISVILRGYIDIIFLTLKCINPKIYTYENLKNISICVGYCCHDDYADDC